jgi:hypothetical protein
MSARLDRDVWGELTAFTTHHVERGEVPVLLVVHNADTTWQFLQGTNVEQEDGVALHASHVLDLDATLLELADLPPEWAAERESVTGEWERYPWPDEWE